MLETDNICSGWEEENYGVIYQEGFQIGRIEWKVSWVKSNLRKEKSPLEVCGDEVTEDIIAFLTKYPALTVEQLAKRILRESEY